MSYTSSILLYTNKFANNVAMFPHPSSNAILCTNYAKEIKYCGNSVPHAGDNTSKHCREYKYVPECCMRNSLLTSFPCRNQ